MIHALVLATYNRGKYEEFRALLAHLPVRLHSLDEVVRPRMTIVEDGETFAENALKKAQAVANATFMLTLADDSGLEVDRLDGKPGVRSARFAHERAADAENNAALLAALEALGDPTSTRMGDDSSRARFRCSLALIDPYAPKGAPIFADGTCEGTIGRAPRGSGGFGYDPLFVVAGTGRTMAELSEAEKNAVSHRSKAVAALVPSLERVLRERDAQVRRILGH